jgi:hypothetical protein
VSPNPIIAQRQSPLRAEWSVTVTETAGIGGQINFTRATVSDGPTTIGTVELGADDISGLLGTNRLEARGSLTAPMDMTLDVSLSCRGLSLAVEAQFGDDRGNVLTGTGQAVVSIRVPALVAPAQGAEMDNGCWDGSDLMSWYFDWEDCPAADAYHLYVKGATARFPAIDSAGLTNSEYLSEGFGWVAPDHRDWFWRVRARFGTQWADWTPERIFHPEVVGTDCVP